VSDRAAGFLVALGLLQMTGDALHSTPLRAVALATGASPAPRVFSTVDGFEAYSTRFAIEWTDEAAATHALEVTPEVYARLRGPYNRRNAYGAAMAGGPVLVGNRYLGGLFDAVARHALCGSAPVGRELGVDVDRASGPLRVRYRPQAPSARPVPLVLDAPCR
jgi:hypothetical protein